MKRQRVDQQAFNHTQPDPKEGQAAPILAIIQATVSGVDDLRSNADQPYISCTYENPIKD